jgi:hypothetical protein
MSESKYPKALWFLINNDVLPYSKTSIKNQGLVLFTFWLLTSISLFYSSLLFIKLLGTEQISLISSSIDPGGSCVKKFESVALLNKAIQSAEISTREMIPEYFYNPTFDFNCSLELDGSNFLQNINLESRVYLMKSFKSFGSVHCQPTSKRIISIRILKIESACSINYDGYSQANFITINGTCFSVSGDFTNQPIPDIEFSKTFTIRNWILNQLHTRLSIETQSFFCFTSSKMNIQEAIVITLGVFLGFSGVVHTLTKCVVRKTSSLEEIAMR